MGLRELLGSLRGRPAPARSAPASPVTPVAGPRMFPPPPPPPPPPPVVPDETAPPGFRIRMMFDDGTVATELRDADEVAELDRIARDLFPPRD